MWTSRRFTILGATVASAMSLGAVFTPAPASAAPPDRAGPQPLTSVLQPVEPQVGVRWTTGPDRRS